MSSSFRYYHIIEILNHYELQKKPLDAFLQYYFRSHKSIGSKDRKEIAHIVYFIFRHKGLIDYLCSSPITWEKRVAQVRKQNITSFFSDTSIPDHIRTSFPKEYYQLLIKAYGKERAFQIATTCNDTAPITIRINLLKTTREELLKRLAPIGAFACEESPLGISFNKRHNFYAFPEFKEGFFEVQDEGSQLISLLVDPQPKDQVLDYCAGAGGKTLGFAPYMRNSGQIYLYDTRPFALKEAKKRLKKAGIQNVQFPSKPSLKKLLHKMDIILLDVPCSGSGTLRRNPDMKWKFSRNHLNELIHLQRHIFTQGISYVKDGGKIIYATCSIFPQENEHQVKYFLRHFPIKLLQKKFWLPQKNGKDGFFAAIFSKKAP